MIVPKTLLLASTRTKTAANANDVSAAGKDPTMLALGFDGWS